MTARAFLLALAPVLALLGVDLWVWILCPECGNIRWIVRFLLALYVAALIGFGIGRA